MVAMLGFYPFGHASIFTRDVGINITVSSVTEDRKKHSVIATVGANHDDSEIANF